MAFSIDFNRYRLVDLSFRLEPPGTEERPFQITRGLLPDNAFKHDIITHSHVGTHVEAPAHFFEGGKDLECLPLETFLGRAVLLEVDGDLDPPDIMPGFVEERIGNILKAGDIVILRNTLADGKREPPEPLPYLTRQAAEWLRDNKIKMLGIDNNIGLSKDIPDGRKIHDILLGADIPIIEIMDNLHELKKREFFLIAFPFRAAAVDSSWARVIAIEEE